MSALDRRSFLRALLVAAAGPLGLGGALRRARAADASLPAETRRLLETSPYVYVSPLLADGSESTCHGEVWYGWIDGRVALITSREAWKARSLRRGLDTARLWVGDHGRWKRLLGRNEGFRQAPHFEARVEAVKDPALVDRLLAIYDEKYPEEIGDWRDRMKRGTATGERVLLLYTPLPA